MNSILALSALFLSASVAFAAPLDANVQQIAEAPMAAPSPESPSLEALKADLLRRTLSEATTHVLAGGTSRTNLRYDLAIASFTKAAALYDEVEAQDLPVDHRRQRLIVLQTLGDLYVTTGSLDKARASFARQQVVASALVKADPGNPVWLGSLASSYLSIGDVARDQGRTADALDAFLRVLDLEKELAASSQDGREAEGRIATAHLKAGFIKSVQGDLAAARHHYDDGLRIVEKLSSGAPGNVEWRQTLASGHFLIGQNLLATNDYDAALASFQSGLDIRLNLAGEEPSNTGRQLDLAASYDGVGVVLHKKEDYRAAVEMFEKAHAISEMVSSAEPQNATFQRHLAFAKAQLGEALFDASEYEKYDEALSIYKASASIRERLATQDPTNTLWQGDLATAYDRLAGMLIANFVAHANASDATNDNSGALGYYKKALSINEKLAALDPGNVGWQRAVRSSYRLIGWTYWQLQDSEQALVNLRAGRDFAINAAAAKPTNDTLLMGVLFANDDIGQLLDRGGDVRGALSAYTDSLAVARQLAKSFPDNPNHLRGLSIAANVVGDRSLTLTLNSNTEALTAYREGIAAIETALKAQPEQVTLLRDLAIGDNRIGDALMKLDRRGDALAAYRNGLQATERLISAQPNEAKWHRDLEFSRERVSGAL